MSVARPKVEMRNRSRSVEVSTLAGDRWAEAALGRLKREERLDDLSAQRGLITSQPLKCAMIIISECFEAMCEISHRSSKRRGIEAFTLTASPRSIFGVITTVGRIGLRADASEWFEYIEVHWPLRFRRLRGRKGQ